MQHQLREVKASVIHLVKNGLHVPANNPPGLCHPAATIFCSSFVLCHHEFLWVVNGGLQAMPKPSNLAAAQAASMNEEDALDAAIAQSLGITGSPDHDQDVHGAGPDGAAPPPEAGVSFANIAQMGFAATGPRLSPGAPKTGETRESLAITGLCLCAQVADCLMHLPLLTHHSAHLLTHPLIQILTCVVSCLPSYSLTPSPTCPPSHPPIHPPTSSLARSLTHSPTHPHTDPLTVPLCA